MPARKINLFSRPTQSGKTMRDDDDDDYYDDDDDDDYRQSTKDDRDRMIKKIRSRLGGENIVAFLGPPNSGKTVIATLLNDSIYKHFLEKNGDKYEARMIKGYEFLKATRGEMLKGTFPSPTLPNNQGEIVVEMGGTDALSRKIQLKIKDLSGEDYESLLVTGDLSPEGRVTKILQQHKTKSMDYGPLGFITIAKMYAVMVDCSLYARWEGLDVDYSQLLNSLLDFQTVVGGDRGEKITRSIAIILTKTDCLPDDVADATAADLLARRMPQFYKTLNMLHSGTREYFKFQIETGRDPSNEPDKGTVKLPWMYSDNEYVRFLTWVLNNILR